MSDEMRMAGLSYVITEYDALVQEQKVTPAAAVLLGDKMHFLSAHWANMRGLPWGGPSDHDDAVADARQYRADNPEAINEFVADFDARHAPSKGG